MNAFEFMSAHPIMTCVLAYFAAEVACELAKAIGKLGSSLACRYGGPAATKSTSDCRMGTKRPGEQGGYAGCSRSGVACDPTEASPDQRTKRGWMGDRSGTPFGPAD